MPNIQNLCGLVSFSSRRLHVQQANFPEFRIVDMFTRASPIKEKVLNSFCAIDGKTLIVLVTCAFGMGIDCPDIRTIIHWGLPSTLQQYVVEQAEIIYPLKLAFFMEVQGDMFNKK